MLPVLLERDATGREGARRTAELGAALLILGDAASAETVCQQALERMAVAGADESLVVAVTSDLGASMLAGGRPDEAEPLLREAAEAALEGKSITPGTTWLGAPLGPLVLERAAAFHEAGAGDDAERAAEAAKWRSAVDRWTRPDGSVPGGDR